MSKARPDLASLAKAALVFVLLVAFFGPALVLRQRYAEELRAVRLNFAAQQLGRRIEQLVRGRADVLVLFGDLIPTLGSDTKEQYGKWSHRFVEDVPGFYAINWVRPDGVIEWVMPEAPNQAARGKNLIERAETRPYILGAREAREPRLSHFIPLYQGRPGFVLYVPVWDETGFRGWLNGVFGVEELFRAVIAPTDDAQFYIQVRVAGHPELTFQSGRDTGPSADTEGFYRFPLLNQTFEVLVRHEGSDPSLRGAVRLERVIVGGVIASSLLLSFLSYLYFHSQRRLKERYEKERLQGILLNLLVHDILNPLLIVRYSVDAAAKVGDDLVRQQLAKTRYGIDQMNEVIQRVKELRALELGKMKPELKPVPINDVIAETLRVFDAQLKEKRITADFRTAQDNPLVLVDRALFQNNVVNNVVSNAIKFSEPGTTVSMRVDPDDYEVLLIVEDQGVGMTEVQIGNIFLENIDVSKPGTKGERGTGIGMLQVAAYMRFFGGKVKLHSRPKSEHPADHGTQVCLALPKAK